MMPEAVLSAEERNVDVCVLGTGLTESFVAAALARRGKQVLHLDRLSSYGGNWRALSLKDFESWANGTEDAELDAFFSQVAPPDEDLTGLTVVDLEVQQPLSCFRCRSVSWDPFNSKSSEELEELQKVVRRSSNSFNIDLAPRLLFARSGFVDVLVESGVARYLEFQGLKSARVLSANGLLTVPMTKSEIFQDPVLTLPEKRTLMRFITSMMPFVGSLAFNSPAQLGVDQAAKVQGPSDPVTNLPEGVDMEEPWPQFLKRQKLSPRLQDYVTYAICMWDFALEETTGADNVPEERGAMLSTREGLRCLGRFVSSLGLHGRGTTMPLLYPMYGAAEVAQGFTRMCALHRGIYALRTGVTKLLAKKDEDSGEWRAAGIVTNRGEVIRARSLVASRDFLDLAATAERRRLAAGPVVDAEEGGSESAAGAGAPGSAIPDDARGMTCVRMTVVADSPILSYQPGESGLGLCVVPPSALQPPLTNVVQVLQLDSSCGACPRGYVVVHLSQVSRTGIVDGSDCFGDLQRVLEALLALCDHGQEHCLLRCNYIHRPRETLRWDPEDSAGEVLEGCRASHSLSVCSDPTALPQLLAEREVEEARELFLKCSVHGDEAIHPEDFLEKPVHVALEEQSCAMDELEAFNEQMQEAQKPKIEQDVAAALERHSEQARLGDFRILPDDAFRAIHLMFGH